MLKKIKDQMVNVHNHTQPATTSSSALTGKGILHGIELKTDGQKDVTLNIYDNTAASGTRLLTSNISILGTSNLVMIDISRYFAKGVYVEISTSGTCSYILEYDN